MLELLALLMVLLSFGPCLYLARALSRLPPGPALESRPPLDTGPAEPCCTEEIISDDRFRYARSHGEHDMLMELDARARVNDFPIQLYGA